MDSENYESVKEFIVKLDAGGLDGNLIAEASRLTDEQRDELIHILLEREAAKPSRSDERRAIPGSGDWFKRKQRFRQRSGAWCCGTTHADIRQLASQFCKNVRLRVTFHGHLSV